METICWVERGQHICPHDVDGIQDAAEKGYCEKCLNFIHEDEFEEIFYSFFGRPLQDYADDFPEGLKYIRDILRNEISRLKIFLKNNTNTPADNDSFNDKIQALRVFVEHLEKLPVSSVG